MDISLSKYAFCFTRDQAHYDKLCKVFSCEGISSPQYFDGHTPYAIKNTAIEYITKKIFEQAIEKQYPYVIIFEDDAYPCIDCVNKFNQILAELDSNNIEWGTLVLGRNGEASGWNGFPGGAFFTKATQKAAAFWTKEGFKSLVTPITSNTICIPKNMFGAHAYIVKQPYFTAAVERFEKFSHVADLSLCYPTMKPVFTKECLFIQHFYYYNSYRYPIWYNDNYSGLPGVFKELPKGFRKYD